MEISAGRYWTGNLPYISSVNYHASLNYEVGSRRSGKENQILQTAGSSTSPSFVHHVLAVPSEEFFHPDHQPESVLKPAKV